MKNKYQAFPKRLTRWLAKDKLDSCIVPFHQYYGAKSEGKEFMVKSNRKKIKPKWAVFIKEENKLRRISDKAVINSMKLVDLVMAVKSQKQEGISILKTISNYL